MTIIEMHLLQYAPSRSFKKSLRLQTNVGCSLNRFVCKKNMTVDYVYAKLRTCTYGDVPMTGGGFDNWRFFRLRFPYRYLRVCPARVISFSRSLIFSRWIVTLLRESWCASAQLFCL